jgi:hypothetical protein
MKQRLVRMPAPRDPQQNQSAGRLQEQVCRRAYELYEVRGREDGHDVEDWLQAESEIAQQQSKSLAA